ncbi:MAG: FAD binding domain-containing protein [Rhodothermia bacterium]|nr:MAG: FAD binding domain-containing protein [Rhodothermia bacterium]
MARELHFILNDSEVHVSEESGTLVLDFLRETKRLTGTKEGCREGDCGACAVLIGELVEDEVHYKSVTSCLMPVGELDGKHLVTIEGLNLEALSAVQQAIVDNGATQCGFCTPGIVVSLTGYLIERNRDIDLNGVKTALGGHLCRCTGYRSLKDCHHHLQSGVGKATGVHELVEGGILPDYFSNIDQRLRAIQIENARERPSGEQFVIAGGTDVYVQWGNDIPGSEPILLNRYPELRGIHDMDDYIGIGALTTFEEFSQHPLVLEYIPEIQEYMMEIASVQIRNRATLAGNVINASPVGDMTILLLALGADLLLKEGEIERIVPLSEFYEGYKELAKTPGELLTEIRIPKPPSDARINWEKVSKRRYLDIASVNSTAVIRVNGRAILEATLTVGGVAPIPLLLASTGRFLKGKQISADVIQEAAAIAQSEIAPISDVRGSADYKRLLVRQLIFAHFLRLVPECISAESLYA